jgi:hypothetical protein
MFVESTATGKSGIDYKTKKAKLVCVASWWIYT